MINKHIVKDNIKLYRDVHSKAIINTDVNALNEYRQKMKLAEDVIQQKNDLNNVQAEINNLRNDISAIKQMMITLINKV